MSNTYTTVAIIADIAAEDAGGTMGIGIVQGTGITPPTTTPTIAAGTDSGLRLHSPSVEVVTGVVDATGVAVTASMVVTASTADAVAGRSLFLW